MASTPSSPVVPMQLRTWAFMRKETGDDPIGEEYGEKVMK
jgi:hypothetical protein